MELVTIGGCTNYVYVAVLLHQECFVIRIQGSFAVLLDYYLKQIGETCVKLNWQAVRIQYQSSGMLLFMLGLE